MHKIICKYCFYKISYKKKINKVEIIFFCQICCIAGARSKTQRILEMATTVLEVALLFTFPPI